MPRLSNAIIKLKNFVKRKRRSFGKEVVYVLGDSHAKVFHYINDNRDLDKVYFDVLSVGGATAMGMVNPNSKTNALKLFSNKMERADRNKPVIIMLGEVDTGFLIWFRALKKGLSVDSQMDLSLTNYFKFVDLLKERGFKKIYLLSAPLPTIPDNHAKYGEIARLRKEVTASLDERTQLTLKYNESLRNHAKQNNLEFIDLDKYLLGDKGVIKKSYLNENPLDHHCDHRPYSKSIIEELYNLSVIPK